MWLVRRSGTLLVYMSVHLSVCSYPPQSDCLPSDCLSDRLSFCSPVLFVGCLPVSLPVGQSSWLSACPPSGQLVSSPVLIVKRSGVAVSDTAVSAAAAARSSVTICVSPDQLRRRRRCSQDVTLRPRKARIRLTPG